VQEKTCVMPSANLTNLPEARLRSVSPETLASAAKRLLSFYPNCQPHDPREFLAGIVKIFRDYSVEAVFAIVDPASGLPSKSKFLSEAEVIEFLRDYDAPAKRAAARAAQEAAQLAERCEREEELEHRPGKTFERCMEELKAAGLLGGKPVKPKRFAPGTVIDYRDFHSATTAHGKPFGPFEAGRETKYKG